MTELGALVILAWMGAGIAGVELNYKLRAIEPELVRASVWWVLSGPMILGTMLICSVFIALERGDSK